jgi:hypothetical protein
MCSAWPRKGRVSRSLPYPLPSIKPDYALVPSAKAISCGHLLLYIFIVVHHVLRDWRVLRFESLRVLRVWPDAAMWLLGVRNAVVDCVPALKGSWNRSGFECWSQRIVPRHRTDVYAAPSEFDRSSVSELLNTSRAELGQMHQSGPRDKAK